MAQILSFCFILFALSNFVHTTPQFSDITKISNDGSIDILQYRAIYTSSLIFLEKISKSKCLPKYFFVDPLPKAKKELRFSVDVSPAEKQEFNNYIGKQIPDLMKNPDAYVDFKTWVAKRGIDKTILCVVDLFKTFVMEYKKSHGILDAAVTSKIQGIKGVLKANELTIRPVCEEIKKIKNGPVKNIVVAVLDIAQYAYEQLGQTDDAYFKQLASVVDKLLLADATSEVRLTRNDPVKYMIVNWKSCGIKCNLKPK